MIEFININLAFENKVLLEDATLQLEEQQLNVIIGSNGSGKTSLLRTLVYDYLPELKIKWIYQPQSIYLFKKKVKDNFNDQSVAFSILEHFDALDLLEKDIKVLSGGEKQIVSLARSFSYPAEIYLLDEPTAHLDTSIRNKVYELLKEKSIDKTILLISHDQKSYFEDANLLKIQNKKINQTKGA